MRYSQQLTDAKTDIGCYVSLRHVIVWIQALCNYLLATEIWFIDQNITTENTRISIFTLTL